MADSDLITRAAGGDPAAFQALVERHRSMVYRVAYQFAGNHHDAEDIAQEVFIKVYRSLDRFRQDAQLSSWLYRIVMNACIDHRRRQLPAGAAPFGEEAEQKMMNTPEETPGPGGARLRRASSGRCSKRKSAGCRTGSGSSSSCGTIRA